MSMKCFEMGFEYENTMQVQSIIIFYYSLQLYN